jgi:hypothetical protein
MYTERPSETCRVIFNKLENCASGWFDCRNINVRKSSDYCDSSRTCDTRQLLSESLYFVANLRHALTMKGVNFVQQRSKEVRGKHLHNHGHIEITS